MCSDHDELYEYVVEEHKGEPAEKKKQDVVHHRLERRRGIGEAEGHHQELEQALVRAEHGLLHVVQMHQHLVVARAHVELREETRAPQLVEELLHHWNWELVLDSGVVESSVIDTETPCVVVLADEECRRGESRGARLANAQAQHVVALTLELILLGVRVSVGADRDGAFAWLQADTVRIRWL
jgi:hypothetical protein